VLEFSLQMHSLVGLRAMTESAALLAIKSAGRKVTFCECEGSVDFWQRAGREESGEDKAIEGNGFNRSDV